MVFIPQIYGIPGQGHRPDDHDPDVAEKYDTVLAYNEPNQEDQSDISPADAAFHYSELALKYKDKVVNILQLKTSVRTKILPCKISLYTNL